MTSLVRSLTLVMFGFLLLVLQSVASAAVPMTHITPQLLLPIVIFLGVSPDVHVVRGAVVSFALGYLMDSFSGSSIGLHTLVLGATFLVARGAGLRLFLRGPAFQVVMTFIVSAFAAGSVLALRAIFDRRPPFPIENAWPTVLAILATAVTTAIAAPFVFAPIRRIEGWMTRRPEESV